MVGTLSLRSWVLLLLTSPSYLPHGEFSFCPPQNNPLDVSSVIQTHSAFPQRSGPEAYFLWQYCLAQCKSDSGSHWPENGTFGFNILRNLDSFCHCNGKGQKSPSSRPSMHPVIVLLSVRLALLIKSDFYTQSPLPQPWTFPPEASDPSFPDQLDPSDPPFDPSPVIQSSVPLWIPQTQLLMPLCLQMPPLCSPLCLPTEPPPLTHSQAPSLQSPLTPPSTLIPRTYPSYRWLGPRVLSRCTSHFPCPISHTLRGVLGLFPPT